MGRSSGNGNPFPLETALVSLDHPGGYELSAEITRSMVLLARSITEAFSIYGEKASFEWQQLEDDAPVLFDMGELVPEQPRENGLKPLGDQPLVTRRN